MDLMFVVPTPGDVTLNDDVATSEVQLAKTGTFFDPRYGKFKITLAEFRKWIDNFTSLSVADGRLGIPIDVDHSPSKSGETKAVGWVKSLRVKGDRLMGKVEWNKLGRELVADKQYAYLSPDYAHNYRDEKGQAHGTMLKGVALTNRPFLRMATVNLCESEVDAQLEDEEVTLAPTRRVLQLAELAAEGTGGGVSDTPLQMPALDDIKVHLKLEADADDAKVLDAIKALNQPKTLEELAQDEGKVVLDADSFGKLSADAASGAAAAKELREAKFDTAFDKALSEGKVTPGQREHFETLYGSTPDVTLKLLDDLEAKVNMAPVGSSGSQAAGGGQAAAALGGLEKGEAIDEERSALFDRATQLSQERSISFSDAAILAEQEVMSGGR